MSKNINELVKDHEALREDGINLIASENRLSRRTREVLSSDLAGRYHSDYYGGSRYAQEILERTQELAKELFDVEYALVKPLSGNICVLNVLFSFTDPGDDVAMLDFDSGGYPLGLKKFHRRRVHLPAEEGTYEIDAEGCRELYSRERIDLTMLGASYIPFPHPVEEITTLVEENQPGGNCVYDGSHVLGLIADGGFQDPLNEGAEVLFGSTHKTFYGPQGGIILTDSAEHEEMMRDYLDIDLETGIGLVDNPHVNRIAALGIALEEMLEDDGYGKRVVENSKELAGTLDDLGVPIKFKDKGYTESHQIFIDIDWETADELCRSLEKEGIFVDRTGRIGTAEVTHRGMDRSDMGEIGKRIAEVYSEGS